MRAIRLRPWPAFGLAAFVVLSVAITAFLYAETAAIAIVIPPQKLEAKVVMNGGGAGSLVVKHIDVQVIDTAQGTATGSTPVAATVATGEVRFLLVCPAIAPCQPATLPAGTIVATTKGFRYATTSTAAMQKGSQYATVGIRAGAAGAAGNTAAATITVIPNNPRPPGILNVLNLQAVSGGADAGVTPVIQQSDLDAAQTALEAKVTDELGSTMQTMAGGMTSVAEGPPGFDLAFDHAVGDQAQSFSLTVTGKLGASVFSDTDAQAVLRAALKPRLTPGYQLTADPIKATYQFVPAADGVGVVISADAVGIAVPQTAMSALRARLTGMSAAAAERRLAHDFPGSSIQIHASPGWAPLLPLFADHITVRVSVALH
ncbi:MAG TPA: baseplate J/gp47 family protein [Candidatus Dormibacteraeota bacterium]